MTTLDVATGCSVKTYTVTGPSSYATGGFLVDGSTDFTWLGFIRPIITTVGSLPPVEFEILLNVDLAGAEALGKGVVKLVRRRYDLPTIGAVSGQPGGVTVQSSLSSNTTTGSSHTHSYDHGHGTITSGAMVQGGAGSTAAVSPDALGHTHNITVASVAKTSGTSTHTHTRPFEYAHRHSFTQADAAIDLVEVANGTNLSSTTFKVMVYGFGQVLP